MEVVINSMEILIKSSVARTLFLDLITLSEEIQTNGSEIRALLSAH